MSFHLQGKISIMLRMGRYTGPKTDFPAGKEKNCLEGSVKLCKDG